MRYAMNTTSVAVVHEATGSGSCTTVCSPSERLLQLKLFLMREAAASPALDINITVTDRTPQRHASLDVWADRPPLMHAS
jgi:hypothetical protein